MTRFLDWFNSVLARPLLARSRLVLLLLVVPLGLTFTQPLWTMRLVAPQYPKGLHLQIYSYTVEGDLREVNTLNHYIGMHAIDRSSLTDLDWLPFALVGLGLLTLRVAVVGDLRALLDLLVLFGYFSGFALFRFYLQLWTFGHNLDPRAPFTVDPFTPAVMGTKQIANFTTTSLPAGASFLLGVFALGVLGVLIWNLRASSRSTAPIRGATGGVP